MDSAGSPTQTGRTVRLGKHAEVMYNEDDVIGRGQFGTVYRGQLKVGGVVAVKLLQNIPSASTPSSREASQQRRSSNLYEAPHRDGAPDPAAGRAPHAAAVPSPSPSGKRPPLSGLPDELSILCEVRADSCPNIIHVLSIWHKQPKPPRRSTTSTAGTDLAVASRTVDAPGAEAPSSSPPVVAPVARSSRVFVMVTEYCAGGDLQQYMRARGAALPAHVARSFTFQLCNALLTLKRRRIVHRDVKPANLLLTATDCEVATLKLADFGMAKAAPPSQKGEEDAGATDDRGGEKAGQPSVPDVTDAASQLFYSEMGTPMYMSPERLALQPYDHKADVYSAGMVLLEMMRGTSVQVKWESQLRTEVPRTIWRELRQHPPDKVPAWLDLVQHMTMADPLRRYAVEDVLRHPWFHVQNGPPLPPLTFRLPEMAAVATDDATNVHNSTAVPGGKEAAARATVPLSPSQRHFCPPHRPTEPPALSSESEVAGVAHRPPPSSSLSCCSSEEAGRDGQCGGSDQAPLPQGNPSPPAPPRWSVLGVCEMLDAAHNIAHGACTTSFAQGTTSLSAAALSLPPGCGPHIITHTVRALVDATYLYVLQDELDAARGLTLVSYLMELMQNGYAAYLNCLESLGCSWRDTAPMNSCVMGGHHLVVREVGLLYGVWRQLMVRLRTAQASYTARLSARTLYSAAAWRRRLIGTVAGTRGDDSEIGPAALAVEEEDDDEGTADDFFQAASEEDDVMPGGASITFLPDAAAVATGAVSHAAVPLKPPRSPRPTARLRASSLGVRAEQLIFEKAVEYVQSEALSMLMDASLPPAPVDTDASEMLEEEEEEEKRQRAIRAKLLPVSSLHAAPGGGSGAKFQTMLPPHRGVALLRVLLRRAVLSLMEVGLEVEAPDAVEPGSPTTPSPVRASVDARSHPTPPLLPLSTQSCPPPPTLPSAEPSVLDSTGGVAPPTFPVEVLARCVYVVTVPVFDTLEEEDARIVEGFLRVVTRALSSVPPLTLC